MMRRIPRLVATLALCLSLVRASQSSQSQSVAALAPAANVAPPSMASSPTVTAAIAVNEPNVVAQLAKYVKSSVTATVDGCGQLWANHGRCKEIRKKLADYRDTIKQEWEDSGVPLDDERKQRLKTMMGGIDFEEYTFLQKGKVDRGKVLNLAFLMWGAPRFLPYALMFNPDMLPSPFHSNDGSGESIWAKRSRERSAAVLQTLVNLEKECKTTPALAKLNIFGRKQQAATKAQLASVIHEAASMMVSANAGDIDSARSVLDRLPLYRAGEDFERSEKRLVGVPSTLIKGMNAIIGGGGGLLAGLSPGFMVRGSVLGHIRKVEEADTFLVDAAIDLGTINKRLLKEACSERLIMGGPGYTESELRMKLADWLALISHEPKARMDEQASAEAPPLYYNSNLARLALMGYYSCCAARDARTTLQLPRLLYAPTRTPSSSDDGPKRLLRKW